MLLVFCTPSSPFEPFSTLSRVSDLPVAGIALEGLRTIELSLSFYPLGLPFRQQAVVSLVKTRGKLLFVEQMWEVPSY